MIDLWKLALPNSRALVDAAKEMEAVAAVVLVEEIDYHPFLTMVC